MSSGSRNHEISDVLAPPETFWKNFCSIGNFSRKLVSGVGLMHFGSIERILSQKKHLQQMLLSGSGRNFQDFRNFCTFSRKMLIDTRLDVTVEIQLSVCEGFPRNMLTTRVDLRSESLQTSEGQIREYLAPPETFWKNFCSIGNFSRKLVSCVDLMHFGPIERFLSPKNQFCPGGGAKLSMA